MAISEGSVIFLLGAGSSVDAGILHAGAMTTEIEDMVNHHPDFIPFKDLYYYIRSCILYQRGIVGDFKNQVVNVEDLLNALYELNKKDRNNLYPFVGSWNIHLTRVAGDMFEKIELLDNNIRKKLLEWVNLKRFADAEYFGGLGSFAREVGYPLRVFTLNYDLCVEKILSRDNITLELGFNHANGEWDASRFDPNDELGIQVYLYKLHGSIDWARDTGKGNILTKCDVPATEPDLIFGIASKLDSIDPYLFYVHELRRYTLEQNLRLIITVGYSFSDEYINKLICQSLSRNQYAKVMVVSPNASAQESDITDKLKIVSDKIVSVNSRASDFFKTQLSSDFCQNHFLINEEMPF